MITPWPGLQGMRDDFVLWVGWEIGHCLLAIMQLKIDA
jgi:hypothetical protein